MPAKPRIAIPIPTSTDPAYNQQSWPNYASAVERAGGDPVEVPLGLNRPAITKLISTCQGILLPGSPADVDPQRYGQATIEATAAPDPAREEVDDLLLQDAFSLRKPVLGICFGTQFLNVWRGGTLIQDLTPMPINHKAGRSVAIAHTAAVAPDSLLSSLLSPDEAPPEDGFLRLPVNSSHHQAIGIPGDGLRVVARSAQDGVIEAVETSSGHMVLAVQWHPERSYDISATSRILFARLVSEAMTWAAGDGSATVAQSMEY